VDATEKMLFGKANAPLHILQRHMSYVSRDYIALCTRRQTTTQFELQVGNTIADLRTTQALVIARGRHREVFDLSTTGQE